jgi:hypothetical protein
METQSPEHWFITLNTTKGIDRIFIDNVIPEISTESINENNFLIRAPLKHQIILMQVIWHRSPRTSFQLYHVFVYLCARVHCISYKFANHKTCSRKPF